MPNYPAPLIEAVRDEIRKAGVERSLCALCDNPGRRMIRCGCEEYAAAAITATLAWMKENVSEEMIEGGANSVLGSISRNGAYVCFRAMIEALEGKSDD